MSRLARWIGRFGGSERTPAAPPAVDAAAATAHAATLERAAQALRARAFADAAVEYRRAIEMRHDDAAAHCGLGVASMKLGEDEDAADSFQLAAHFGEDYAEPHYNLALLAQRHGDLPAAMAHLERALARNPGYAEAHNLLGACRLAAGDVDGALTALRQAVKLAPDNAHFQSNLGYVLLRDLGDAAGGAAHLETAMRLNGDDPAIQCNYCTLLSQQGRLDEVIAICDRLLEVDPGLEEARLNRGLARLKLERYAEAWPDYEARRRTRSNYLPRPYAFPEWRGEPLSGKTVLVYAEQGLGDEIMFASCLPDLASQAARCIVDCSPRLTALFARSFPFAQVHGAVQTDGDCEWLRPLAPVDYQSAAGSLPGFFRRRREDFPAHDGYLRADPARVAHWRTRFAADAPARRIGLAWRGGMASTRRRERSLELAALASLWQVPDVRFVSLQHDATADEVAAFTARNGLALDHDAQVLADLDETAALISALDLVITVCSANVHLAGALGRPAWVMVPVVAEWRYLAAGERMAWYPSVRLFRQAQAGEWVPVIDAVARALTEGGA